MGKRETTSLRASLAAHALGEYVRRTPGAGPENYIVQLMADLRILCGREGLSAERLFELSKAHAESYPAP